MHVEYVGQEGRILILLELHQFMMIWKESVPGKVDGSWQSLSSVGLHPGYLKDTWGFARDLTPPSLSCKCHTKTAPLSAWISTLIMTREEGWHAVGAQVLVLDFTSLRHPFLRQSPPFVKGNSPNYTAVNHRASWNPVLHRFPFLRGLRNLLQMHVLERTSQREGAEVHKV